MKPNLLYRIFAIGVLIVVMILGALKSLEPQVAHEDSGDVPNSSPLNEVEFESGTLAKNLKDQQETRLNSYRGDWQKDQSVEVPFNRALDSYLKEHSNEVKP